MTIFTKNVSKKSSFEWYFLYDDVLYEQMRKLIAYAKDLIQLFNLKKLRQSITWFESYFSNRRFQVHIKNKYSNVANINSGVPQRSILGPLLFLLYVNDMSQAAGCELFLLVYQHNC